MSEPSATNASAPPSCPKCGGAMWDNREGKRNPKAPDFKCKDRSCDGVVWPPRAAPSPPPAAPADATRVAAAPPPPPKGTRPGAHVAQRVDAEGMPLCPICGGPMWDDRASKRNPRAPDFKCRNKPRERGGPGCEGVIWPARDGSPSPYPPPRARRSAPGPAAPPPYDAPLEDGPPLWDGPAPDDDVPF